MNNIREIIEEEVVRRGVISFARFMELALYCPNLGYYERPDVSPGRQGDFFTSVSVGKLFGELLAFQFSGWIKAAPAGKWQVLEAGAHEGRLAADILHWLEGHRPDLLKSLDYWILEPSASRRQSQERTLGGLRGGVRWFDAWGALPPSGVHGVIFSSELLDAMPVHRLGWDAAGKKWFEWGVSLKDGDFAWTKMPENEGFKVARGRLELPPELIEVLPDGFTTEVCPAASEWWRQAAGVLKGGKLVAIDYGLTVEELFMPQRREGTLRAYHRHHPGRNVLAHVGEQDITAHANFSAIREAGEAGGLRTEALISQAQFLTGIAEKMWKEKGLMAEWNSTRARQFQTLTHPEHLGQSFRVL